MVPSWTETLLAAGITVVGRTRYCIHPAKDVSSIPVVGGTKDWDWDKIQALTPDLIILDQEENPLFMAEQASIPFLATHITSVESVSVELRNLGLHLKNDFLMKLAQEWQRLTPYRGELPGVVQWGLRPSAQPQSVYYVIWKNPWMVVSRDTFVGSMLSYCGIEVPFFDKKYPVIEEARLRDQQNALLLFSTEPYPFLKHRDELAKLGTPYALVDGEQFSWFGLRSLRFLQGLSRS